MTYRPTEQRYTRQPGWFASSGLKEALAKGGCPVCQAVKTSVRRYLFSFLYEGMMSGAARGEFLRGGGFCSRHFWEAKGIEEECWAEGFGVAILCENLLDESLKDLELFADDPHHLEDSSSQTPKAVKEAAASVSSGSRNWLHCLHDVEGYGGALLGGSGGVAQRGGFRRPLSAGNGTVFSSSRSGGRKLGISGGPDVDQDHGPKDRATAD